MIDILLLLPEIYLAMTLAGIIGSEISYHGEKTRLVVAIALAGLGASFFQTISLINTERLRFWGMPWRLMDYPSFSNCFLMDWPLWRSSAPFSRKRSR